jgi:nucleoside-diphosphate kinase
MVDFHILRLLFFLSYLPLKKRSITLQRTLVIIKPDAVIRGYTGKIIARFEENGLKVIALRMMKLSKQEAQQFYHVHKDQYFFESLTSFMSSDPVVAMILEGGADTITKVRNIMGATDPAEAGEGTIRKDFATDKEKNSVHGSDSGKSVDFEVPFFFCALDQMEYSRIS